MTSTPLPLSRRIHRLKIRLRKRADCVLWCVLIVGMVPVVIVMLVMQHFGYEFENDGQGCTDAEHALMLTQFLNCPITSVEP